MLTMSYQRHTTKAIPKIEIASVFTAIPGVKEYTPPESAQVFADATELEDDDMTEASIGRRQPKPGKLVLRFDPQNAVHVALLDANDADDPADCDLELETHYPTSTGLVEAVTISPELASPGKLDPKGFYEKEFTLRCRSKITRTIT